MSSEHYKTTIQEHPFYGEGFYLMETQSDPDCIEGGVNKLRRNIERAGRFYQPLKWLARTGIFGTAAYLLLTGGHENEREIGIVGVIFMVSLLAHELYKNDFAKWESRKKAFEETFNERIHLIPERFHPRRLLGRLRR